MVEIGGRPILWHVMMHYYHFGFKEFVIALGYKGEYIKRWMQEFCSLSKDMTVKTDTGNVIFHDRIKQDWPDWTVHLVETGQKTLTGGRIKRLAPWLNNQTFMLTWCDSVADVNLDALLKFHRSHGRLATVTAVRPPSRFGCLVIRGDRVAKFKEKPIATRSWINGAFFVLEPGVFNYIEGDDTQWEKEPLERLASDGQLMAYRHTGFWQCMDTLHEKLLLEKLWQTGQAPWKTWKD
jgi:glucose-1-phosphate cytidylyltransferase